MKNRRLKILFLHRSVGANLIREGRLREKLSQINIRLDDYNNNTGLLTQTDGVTRTNAIVMPGNNTNPDNFAKFFNNWPGILNSYDVIMIKSCYPNSHIKSDRQLEAIKREYIAIFQSFTKHPKKKLLILSTPPLRPFSTNKTEAQLADKLAQWLVANSKENIFVFDLHSLLTEQAQKYAGMLKNRYRHKLMFWDNHPNKKASKHIVPMLVTFVMDIGAK